MTNATDPKLEINTSRQFTSWFREQRLSLAFTTYQAGKLFLLDLRTVGRPSVFDRTFKRCVELLPIGKVIWTSLLLQLLQFESVLEPKQSASGFDRLDVPQVVATTGTFDIRDVAVVNTYFGRLSRLINTHNFVPLSNHPHVRSPAKDVCCHSNGIAFPLSWTR